LAFPDGIVAMAPQSASEQTPTYQHFSAKFRSVELARILLVSSIFALTLILTIRIYLSWKYADDLDHVSGVWSALASDFSRGIFYRPLYSAGIGFGGTRYFPLHFVLHGALLHFGGIIPMGHLLDFTAFVLLLLGVYAFLRRYQIPRFYASALAMLIPASKSGQLAPLTIRSDALPLMLNVWAMVICLSPQLDWIRLVSASLLFTLAFAAKQTSVYALVAVCVAFLMSGRQKDALKISCLSLIGIGSVLTLMFVLSNGHVFAMMKSVTLEGASPSSFLMAPLALLAWIRDPGSVAFFVLACSSLFMLPAARLKELPALFFVFASGAVGIVLTSPGTIWNHLIDVQVAAICIFGTWLFRERDQRTLHFGLALLAMAALISVFPAALDLRHERALPRINKYDEAKSILQSVRDPILAEDALIPIIASQQPYVIDPMTIAKLSQRNPAFAEPLQEMLDRQAFGAVVLQLDQHTADGDGWYKNWAFGPWFIPALNKNYELRFVSRGLFFYFPRPR
jgi:hypothetical protein